MALRSAKPPQKRRPQERRARKTTGPDEGKGGKYLVLPPGYDGDVPDGYFLLKPPTNRNFMFLRGSIAKGLEPAVDNITSRLRVYPLKDAAKAHADLAARKTTGSTVLTV